GTQTVIWRRFKERTQNARGQWITEYYPDASLDGSWQPVDAQTVQELQLDTSKRYHNLYTSNPVDNVNRGKAPDLIVADGKLHTVIGSTDWYRQNGWRGILAVENESEST